MSPPMVRLGGYAIGVVLARSTASWALILHRMPQRKQNLDMSSDMFRGVITFGCDPVDLLIARIDSRQVMLHEASLDADKLVDAAQRVVAFLSVVVVVAACGVVCGAFVAAA
ncbi:hypothetical protein AC1031_009556 [Aphanomyces cochlioides]|nr:hypothetical protein AC1031_009556 [Aphanomyces cochlioides]